MIEIDIPSIDPIQHEPKVFMGMTARQILCIVPGVALGVFLFIVTRKISSDLSVISCGLAIGPAVALGWFKPYNMKFEDYVKLLYFNNFVASPKRIYKTDMAEEVKLPSMKERQEQEKKAKDDAFAKRKSKKDKKNLGEEL